MTLEPLLMALLAATGSSVLLAARLDRWRDHLALSLPAGTAVAAGVSLVLFVAPVRYSAGRVSAALLVVAGALLMLRLRSVAGHARWRLLLPASIIAVSMLPLSLVVRRMRLTRVTADSFEYLQSGGVAQAIGGPFDDAFLLVNRQLLSPLVHNLAALGGEWFLVSLAPLFFASLLATLWWLIASDRAPERVAAEMVIAVVAAVLLLISTNRVLFHAFYMNAHLFVGTYLLQIAGLGWLLRKRKVDRRVVALVALLIVPVAIARPEGPLLLLLLLTPLVLAGVEQAQLRLIALSFGGVVLVWWVVGLGPLAGWAPTSPSVAVLASAVGFAVLVRLSGTAVVGPWLRRSAQPLFHGGLWLALGVAIAVGGSPVLVDSLTATWQNLRWEGIWGSTPFVLAGGLAVSLAVRRGRHHQIFTFPILTFVPLMLLLAYVREGSYRVGPGDSLNRAWMHIVPLILGYLLLVISDQDESGALEQRPSSSAERA